MPNITVYWYKHNMLLHHSNLKQLIKFYERIILPSEHREAFKALITEMEDLINSAFADAYNANMERRRKDEKADELPF